MGKPFVGPAGKLMQAMMSGAGWDLDGVAWANVVSCRSEGPPTMVQRKACRGNLRDQVVASGAMYIVLAGSTALDAFRGDLRIGNVHGQVFVWGGMWVIMPTWHPAAVLRNPALKKEVIEDLREFRACVESPTPLNWLGVFCIKCGDRAVHYDPDGVPWCELHYLKCGELWKKEARRWSNEKAKLIKGTKVQVEMEGQEVML